MHFIATTFFFVNLVCIICHTTQQKNKALVLARNNTKQFSWCFTYSTAQLWNKLSNEAVFAFQGVFNKLNDNLLEFHSTCITAVFPFV